MNHENDPQPRPEDAADAHDAHDAPGQDEPAAEGRAGGSPAPDLSNAFEEFSAALKSAARQGRADAKQAFEQAMPKLKKDLNQGAHDLAYAVSFAAAFGFEILRELTPDSLASGAREGRDAGRRAAEDAIRRQRERQARAERTKAESAACEGASDSPETAPA